ncbi:monosaccharide ABC transporter substrate-binding protein, CUT2 family (TC 3.A.1.2.-) [Geodermatophilus amargosae]|uniref:Monosaccharide ABC transporter substrate-binding protein, CUT2 family (TC 3.A.1.2.-) n=1 Tax=Geodermatophilus amargosae TaxID=1296565 RepID=A0A1I7C3W5_9ACTN|nr:substrate-binding domain-containing protein [Geodermatophilus amargosae]SFT94064.1 monosaccharide ABC transporter substrate-binding protein, CUT2 family (TC 3.A.1.2.-) [Geodermatophilus amargosae]
MARRRTTMTALAASLVFSLAACGGDSGGETGGGGGGGEGGGEAAGKVGVILPDTESSVRWENFDRPYLEAAFEEAGVEYDIQNAEGDAQRQATIAEQMITEGATVLAIVNLDSASGAQIQEQAANEGVATIDYDRLTLGGSAEYYVSFDNTEVGRLQGAGLQQCLEANGVTQGNIAFLNGSPDDNNATLFSSGAHEVLDPLTQYPQVAEQAVPEWDNQEAATIFEQMYTQANGDIAGVLAANDGLANSVIQILGRNNAAGQANVTGQDASVEGLQNILAGDQCMTVYKSVRDEANALAELAVALINGEEAETTGTVEDTEAGRDVPSVLLTPVSIFRDNVKDVVDDEFVTAEELCTGDFAAACQELGIS